MSLAQHLPPQPAAPILNLNGTDGQELFDANRKVVHMLDEAVAALQQTAPHGRDYIGHPEEFARAREEHWHRLNTLRGMVHELDILAFRIHQQRRKEA
jgi:hypothetical protein